MQNNPCEIDADGNVFFAKGYGYAQETFWLYSCRNEAGAFDVTVKDCPLLNPKRGSSSH